MKAVRGLRNIHEPPHGAVVTLGNFDGVHLGHQAIFRRVNARARQIGGTSIVYTFDPHPLKILAPEQNVTLLCTFKKKMELIAAHGIEMTILADFTRQFARMHPRDFALKLWNGLKMDTVIVGHDYSFGQGKAGSIDYLRKMGDEIGFAVEVVDAVESGGQRVSSSLIREFLNTGQLSRANEMLGRCYSIEGRVVSGYARGRAIGFPTANLETPYEVVPAVGVYAVVARLAHGRAYDGVVNVGYNPTFNRDDLIVEAHLFDFEGDLYHQEIEVYFVERLRDEASFGSVDALKAQIASDIGRAREILSRRRARGECLDPRLD
ncbi:MAG: bifunctional riboflavin kinase/FAD synthetase [Nitrospinae bacterium]|nr:bifunctional riboflavin kinase/FAD synthetase [Nitrospinota bacterium]